MRELATQPFLAAGGTGDARHSVVHDSKTPTRCSIMAKALRSPPWTGYGWLPASSYMCSCCKEMINTSPQICLN